MLASLHIKNIVLIDQLTIHFSEGLGALTGETGAGKSILLDSLGLSLGMRADAKLIRHGQDQASVTAEFDLPLSHPVFSYLKDNSIETEGSVIVKRVIMTDGRSKAYINDQPVSLALLKSVSDYLVEMHGQFDTHSLLNAATHGAMLDEYSGLTAEVSAVANAWAQYKNLQTELDSLKAQIDKARSDEFYYRQSLEDIDALSPKEGEEEKLTALKSRLAKREQIAAGLNEAVQGLSEMESLAGKVWKSLNRLGEEATAVTKVMDQMMIDMNEAVHAIDSLSAELDHSEYSLAEIDDRLYALKAQARKHGCLIDELPRKREEIAGLLNAIKNHDQKIMDLMKQVDKAQVFYQEKARILSDKRKKAAVKLEKLIMAEFSPLKLDKAHFVIESQEKDKKDWNENGIDRIRFLIATNPGAAPAPLDKIASGGELARFMLALKVVMAQTGMATTLIFDEVDSGIGGATAAAVGERLARLAQHKQILVVTHSPQVAAKAQHHWIVSKSGDKAVTTNIMPLLEHKQRQEEIARMLAGAKITDEARAAADKLLEQSAA